MTTSPTLPRIVIADKGIVERRHRVAHEAANREEFGLDPAYRPCSVCMPDAYRAWKERQKDRAS